jgi:hypothetical protein
VAACFIEEVTELSNRLLPDVFIIWLAKFWGQRGRREGGREEGEREGGREILNMPNYNYRS